MIKIKSNLEKILRTTVLGAGLLFAGCEGPITREDAEFRDSYLAPVKDYITDYNLDVQKLRCYIAKDLQSVKFAESKWQAAGAPPIIALIQHEPEFKVGPYLIRDGLPFRTGREPYTETPLHKENKNKLTLESQLTEEEKSYFPLAEGNTWAYQRTINDNVISHIIAYPLTIGAVVSNPFQVTFLDPSYKNIFYLILSSVNPIKHYVRESLQKISEETYTISKERGGFFDPVSKHWDVAISSRNSRDGRYADLIGFVKWEYYKGCVAETRETNVEGLKIYENSWIGILRSDILWSHRHAQTRTILPPVESKAIVQNQNLDIGATKYNGIITVPAGTFTDCIKNIFMVNGKNIEDVLLKNSAPEYNIQSLEGIISEKERWEAIEGALEPLKEKLKDIPKDEIEKQRGKEEIEKVIHTALTEKIMEKIPKEYLPYLTGFTTESYFAKGVGLVKEVQYNALGKETYRLELKSYNVK